MGNQYLVGAGRPALVAMNPIGATFWVGASTTSAYNGVAPSDNNLGTSPREPVATLTKALSLCTAGRGDRIILGPGTYSLAAAFALNKADVSLYSYEEKAAIITGDAGVVELFQIDADDVTVDGLTFSAGVSVTTAIDIGDTAACSRVKIRNINVLGASPTSMTGVRIGDGTNDAADVVVEDSMFDRCFQAVVWNGTRARIQRNFVVIPVAASATGVFVPLRASIAVRSFGLIDTNVFLGAGDGAGSMLAVIFEGAEASNPIYALRGNDILNCSSITANRHPEGVGVNYLGTATGTAPALVQG